MADLIINSEQSLSLAIGTLRETFKASKFFSIRIKIGKPRSRGQNETSHVWYQQIADELREDDARGVKRFCKLHFGVPILRADDAEFRDSYDGTIKHTLNYEQKLIAMDMLPVTSIMTTKQLTRYMEDMQDHYRKFGVDLKFQEKA